MFGWPFQNEHQSTNPIRTLLLGGFLFYFAIFVILPQLFVMGYIVRVLRYAIDSNEPPPVFNKWGGLLVDGTKAYTIWVAYLLLPTVLILSTQNETVINDVIFLIIGLLFGGIIGGMLPLLIENTLTGAGTQFGETFPHQLFNAVLPLLNSEIIGSILFVSALYVAPAGLLNFVDRNSYRSGFDIRDFGAVLLNRWYLVGWLIFIVFWAISLITISVQVFEPLNLIEHSLRMFDLLIIANQTVENLLTLLTLFGFYMLVMGHYFIGRCWEYASRSQDIVLSPLLTILDRKPVATILVGSFLISTGTVLFGIFVMGYLVRLLRHSSSDKLPVFDNWPQLFVDGVKSLIIWLGYAAVPLLLLTLRSDTYITYQYVIVERTPSVPESSIISTTILYRFLGINLGAPIVGSFLYFAVDVIRIAESFINWRMSWNNDLDLLFTIAYLAVSLLIIYIFPAALSNFAVKNTISAGFQAKYLISIARKKEYALNWAKAFLLWVISSSLLVIDTLWKLPSRRPQYLGTDLRQTLRVNHFIASPNIKLIGEIPIISIGTSYGILAASTNIMSSIILFYIFIKTYKSIGGLWQDLTSRDTNPERR